MEQIEMDNLAKIKAINEFKISDKVDGYFIIKSYDIKKTNNGKEYADIILSDKTGQINAKLWDCNEKYKNILKTCSIVKVRGDVTEWQGNKQFKIMKIRNITNEDNIILSEIVPSAPIESSDMFNDIVMYINKIKDDKIRKLVDRLINKYKDKLLFYPAAKNNHHSYRGGLLYHVLRMLQTGEKIGQIYEYLDMDYVYAGVLLHDICKLNEMDANELGIVSDYTMEGKLLGHIVQGIKEIEIEAEKADLDKEKSILLQHMIFSHHYHPEFGSPKKPMIPEAELLHYLDIIDARMFDFKNVLDSIEPGEFSDRVWVLDNRNVYKKEL